MATLSTAALTVANPEGVERVRVNDGATDHSRPNILVLMLDTVRADHLSLYGYDLPTTPELERLRDRDSRAKVYTSAYSSSSWTLPAHASLFTGEISSVHQVHFGNGGMEGDIWSVDLGQTLAEGLLEVGYRTTGILSNPILTTLGGIDAGFESWSYAEKPQLSSLPGELFRRKIFPDFYTKQALVRPSALQINRAILREFSHCPTGGCFVFANYMEAHEPYLPGPANAGRFRDASLERGELALVYPAADERIEYMSHVYDEAVRDLDADLGLLFDALESRGILDDMWLVVTSDHGEAFFEHRAILHASNLYNEETRIPLMIIPPRGERLPRVAGPVSLVDVAATLSSIGTGAGLGHGRDLRDPAIKATHVQLELFAKPPGGRNAGPDAGKPARVAVEGKWKLMEIDGRLELYDLDLDPRETKNLAHERPELVARMRALLPPLVLRSDRVVKGEGKLDERTLQSLRAIGYIE